jgi:hypothetical protein
MTKIGYLLAACFLLGPSASGTDAPKPSANQFGIKPEGIATPEMRDALTRMHEAGFAEGKRGTLTFFRWTDAQPPKLAHLGLWGAKVNDEVIALAKAMPDLENVSLYETDVTDKGVKALLSLAKLRSLAILPITRYEKAGFGPPQWSYPFLAARADRPRITGGVLVGLEAVKTLESVELLDAQLKPGDLKSLAAWPKLSNVSLPNAIDAETVKHLQSCKRLTSLTLGYRAITAEELTLLAEWKSLRKLTLIHAQLSPDALRALSNLETVEEIHLNDCGLKDEHMADLRGSPKLTYLTLPRNEIDGPGLEHIAKLQLKKLGLEFNNISDATLHHLSQLTSVDNLALSYCRGITNKGIQSGTLQKMTHLKQLGLRGLTFITDASLDDMVKMTHLEHVTIRETKIGPEGVERMKKAMPKTVVFK